MSVPEYIVACQGAGSPVNCQSAGQRRDTDRKNPLVRLGVHLNELADIIKVNDQVPETELYLGSAGLAHHIIKPFLCLFPMINIPVTMGGVRL